MDSNGIIDLLDQYDTLTVSTTPDTSNQYFTEGDTVIARVDCTGNPSNGLDYYDGWYIFRLYDGASVYFFDHNMLSIASVNPFTYRLKSLSGETTGYSVSFTSGTTNYWDIAQIYLYPRTAAADLDIYLTYQATTLASVTDASNWVDTDGEITANATLASDLESVKITALFANSDLGWGWRNYGVSMNGELEVFESAIIMTTTMAAINPTHLAGHGWQPIDYGPLYTEVGYYKVIGPYYPAKGHKTDMSVEISLDATAAAGSTAFLFKFWLVDMHEMSDLANGHSSTTVATAYGFMTAYGPGAKMHNTAFTTSSGAGATEQLRVYLTTA